MAQFPTAALVKMTWSFHVVLFKIGSIEALFIASACLSDLPAILAVQSQLSRQIAMVYVADRNRTAAFEIY